MVNYEIFLSKIKYCGVSNSSLLFIELCLTNRQKDRTSKHISSRKYIPSEVPQGTVLVPLVFLIYTIDLHSYVEQCTLQLFSDDAHLTFTFNSANVDSVSYKLNIDVIKMYYCPNHSIIFLLFYIHLYDLLPEF